MPRLLEALGTLPGGQVHRLTTDQATRFLRDKYFPDQTGEKHRRKETKKRLDLYRDRGRVHFEDAVNRLFKNPKVRQWRKDFVEYAEFQNITKRIIREISSVYSEPADRVVSKGPERYREFQREIRFDRVMRKVNQLGNLTNNILVWPDVAARGPVMRTVTQDKFTVVTHPNDPLEPIAYIVDQFPGGLDIRPTAPHYLGMTDAEFFWLDKDWNFVRSEDHQLGTLPALLWSREEPDESLLDCTSGKDLMSAHLAVALLNILMLKHQKGGTKLPYATGDTSNVPLDQPRDEENIVLLGEGVGIGSLDLGADPQSYIDSTRAVIKQVAANWGIPESVFDLSYQATSGFEIELKRTGLREIRRDQILNFRDFEKKLAELWSRVLSASGSEWVFDPAGWSIDFGEIDTPQEPMAKLGYWEKLEAMGLINKVQMYMELHPEATPEEAAKAIEANQRMRLQWMEPFQKANAPTGPERDPGGQPRNGVPEPETTEPDDSEEEDQAA